MKIKNTLAQILLIFVSISLVSCQFKCNVPGAKSNFTIGEQGVAVVCIHIELPSQPLRTYAFKVTVDKFSALTIKGIGDILKSQTQKTKAYVQFQNNDTKYEMDIYRTSPKSMYRDVFSFVVNLKDGLHDGIALDNAKCDVCSIGDSTEYCDEKEDQCFTFASSYGGDEVNDPKFFISWIGTDSAGNHMLSHTRRLSRFTQYSVGSVYQKAKKFVTQNV